MRTSSTSTPLRETARPAAGGVRVLGPDPEAPWLHGGEGGVEAALRRATDLSDLSDELVAAGPGWPTMADCARERGHIVRALDLAPDACVLEVGAGCGAVTRHLAERVGSVDALEPVPYRARLAARRVADIPTAQVVVGAVEDIPVAPVYDVIVVIGVLEYVGGWRGREDRLAFLSRLRACLRPGGHVVCAIENRFGVSHLAGRAEDHSGRLFEGIEGYPAPTHAETFGRRALEGLFVEAGLAPEVFGVFPDYRFPRCVLAPGLYASVAQPMAWQLPQFPTPPHPSHEHAAVLDEARVWRGLVEEGIGESFANSHLVVAGLEQPQTLWEPGLLATFYGPGRRRAFAYEGRVVDGDDGVIVSRTFLRPADPDVPVRRSDVEEPFVRGETLVDVLIAAETAGDGDAVSRWLRDYVALVRGCESRDEVPFDLWPANIVVADGRLVAVDTELTTQGHPLSDVWLRGLLLTAMVMAARRPAEAPAKTMLAEQAAALCASAGVPAPDSWAPIVAWQAELEADIFGGARGTAAWDHAREAAADGLRAALRSVPEPGVVARRDAGPGYHERVADRLEGRHATAGEAPGGDPGRALGIVALEARVEDATVRLARCERVLTDVVESSSWRLTRPLRWAKHRLRG